ncbi:MAG: formate dehydrogenase accessory sulfurtransferase FdhD [Planctomycetes bacterium]|nr:formate dehydrogenase accessory sulfurtransferase FdhD [Planctomycetota bacterium]
MAQTSESYPVWRHRGGGVVEAARDEVVCEEPLEIRVAGRGVGITMRTPGHDEELALGFLVGEGVIARREDVEHVRGCDKAAGEGVDVIVSARVAVDFARLTRHVFASSSCGVCGSATIDSVRKQFAPLAGGPVVAESVVYGLAETLRGSQPTFEKTGGLHAAGLFDGEGRLLVAREDIGRHNAVDKVVGHALRAGMLPLSGHVLMVSGRVSFEIVQKAVAAGIGVVAAVSAPSSLAIDLAGEANVTLVGFLREGRFTVYAHPERVRG